MPETREPDEYGIIPPDPALVKRRRTAYIAKHSLIGLISVVTAVVLAEIDSLGAAVMVFGALHTAIPFILTILITFFVCQMALFVWNSG